MKSLPITVDQLAEHWGMTPRRVRMLADEIPIKRRGEVFDLLEADREYIGWLQRDEPTRRAKRELMAWQRQRIEASIAREDRKVLLPAEICALIDEAWEAMRQGHLGGLNTMFTALQYRRADETAEQLVLRIENQVNDWMAKARDDLGDVYGRAIEKLESVNRNGIITCDRRIKALTEAIGPELDA